MKDLLKEGERIPPFVLITTHGRPARYAHLQRNRRMVLLVMDEEAAPGDNTHAWLAEAVRAFNEFEDRDMTVLVLAPDPTKIKEAKEMPSPFYALRDRDRKTIERLGAAPAFYLVGKDSGIKRASRRCPGLRELFALVDRMPMRQQEIKRKQ